MTTPLTSSELSGLFPGPVIVTAIPASEVFEITKKGNGVLFMNDAKGELFTVTQLDPDWRAHWCETCKGVTAHTKRGKVWVCRHEVKA